MGNKQVYMSEETHALLKVMASVKGQHMNSLADKIVQDNFRLDEEDIIESDVEEEYKQTALNYN